MSIAHQVARILLEAALDYEQSAGRARREELEGKGPGAECSEEGINQEERNGPVGPSEISNQPRPEDPKEL